ncbi:YceI family protein [Protofrankia symbiont of Coriaria ruscifolia]|uniref:YceI family protein n=1 Tax=Protofrankia symbiont of Coriaria ruscifolia TaxID=1306542 RepID=UPI0010416E18|nr:YceI family protein [Protofrankia symbiont of Coriaria ruscifolia]
MAERTVFSRGVAAPRTGTYRIDPARSTVRFTTRGLFGLLKVVGTLAVREGSIVVADPVEKSTVRAVIDATSLDTANRTRDKHLRAADFLDVETYPDITFTSERLVETVGTWTLFGILTVHRVSRPVELTITAAEPTEPTEPTNGEVRFQAVTRTDRHEFGVSKGKAAVARHQAIDLDLVAVLL